MADSDAITLLPAFTALDAALVTRGEKRGASLQLNETYFTGQLQVLRTIDESKGIEARIRALRQSAAVYEDVDVEFESLTRDTLLTASRRLRDLFGQLPEVTALRTAFPGTCFVVPEWLQAEGTIRYGARVYFFHDAAPDPERIVRSNIDAVLERERESFDRYRGRLHGYPDCCIEFFHDRTSGSPPEMRSVEPYDACIDDRRLDAESSGSRSIDRVVSGFLETDGHSAFFARAFYPEPNCDAARTRGASIRSALLETYPERLVDDFFRLNFGICYCRAKGVIEGAKSHPKSGCLGREHRCWYLPLRVLLSLSRYS